MSATPDPVASPAARPPTLRDVAVLAGVSPMTVSRVFSGNLNVRPEVQERVRSAASTLGYRRNENARSLRPGHRSGLIGVTITNIANPYYAEMQRGIEEVAAEHSRRILIGNSNEDAELESRLVADFLGRQVEGLIVVPSGSAADSVHLRTAAQGGVPIALASRALDDLDVDTVLVDDIGGAFAATDRILAEGHTRVGFLGTQASVFTGRRRLQGFRDAHAVRGIAIDEDLVLAGQRDVQSAEAAMQALLQLADPPTAVFTANNRNTIGAIRAIELDRRRRRSAAPLRIRLIGFDSFEFADLSPVPLSVVAHDARELGRRAASMLLERIEGLDPAVAGRVIELPARLQEVPAP
ncbi:LacI family DNA-binding transcriptional regulator [Schumannella luteola]|uniref:LacI family transcriptional regulator n=1 Tax=Schumannella luteola TaxID=472059 RepID=A0A852YAN7_9MICO|nr:LacI family DNA-binding transcriptional regulator [Schumannella luteola]NYG98420.1 LacI family transcriptional regulator [Schumannella luteola]TPX01344.1 LacI family transcriptional regulator [Schumannella luteola]